MEAGLKHSICLLCVEKRFGNIPWFRRRMKTIHLSMKSLIYLKQYYKFASSSIPSWAKAVEIYCYATKTGDFKLKSVCEAYFSENPLKRPEAIHMTHRANEMGIGDNFLFPDGTRFKTSPDPKSLEYFFLQNSKRLDFKQLIVPLKERTPDGTNPERLEGSYNTDIENDVCLNVRKGVCRIIGVEMQFRNPGVADDDLKIKVSCKAFNEASNSKTEACEEREMVLRNTNDPQVLVIRFKNPLKVHLEHTALVRVTVQDIMPCWCPYILSKNQELEKQFRANFKSDCNDNHQNELFFVTKLFYT